VKKPWRHDYAGWAVLALAAGIAVGWAGAILLAASEDDPLSANGLQLLSGLGGAMIGVVGTYVGMHAAHRLLRLRRDENGHEENEEPPVSEDTMELPPSRRRPHEHH
jgi:hypothetical protein